jgi:GrpB-like predicted nucleotidyltransferase (UPF0157 family)
LIVAVSPLPLVLEHTGSTAIPGLAAKPILDILGGIPAGASFEPYIERLSGADYIHRGNQGIPGREFFRRGFPRAYHLHLTTLDNQFWRDHLAFRDYLRLHSDARDEYGRLKLELAERFPNDRESYIDAKSEFVKGTLELAARDP